MWTALSPQGVEILKDGITQILKSWTALQLAVQNEWGGRGSATKYQEFHTTILDFFVSSRGQRYINELEDLLDGYMLNNLSTDVDDGSIFDVAEQLMMLHEKLMLGNFDEARTMLPPSPPDAPGGNGQSVRDSQEVPSAEDQEDADGNDKVEPGHPAVDKMDAEYPAEVANPAPVATPTQFLTKEEISEGWQAAPTRKSRRGKGQ